MVEFCEDGNKLSDNVKAGTKYLDRLRLPIFEVTYFLSSTFVNPHMVNVVFDFSVLVINNVFEIKGNKISAPTKNDEKWTQLRLTL